jgi:ligand-binding sensor domain-containing protein
MVRLLLLTFCFLFSLNRLVAQEASFSKPALQFQHLTEGLNNERITAIHQDQRGFIWIGTYNGLHRYDGIRFKIYQSNSDAASLPHSRIERIFSDSKGNLWIGTANSICRYNREYDHFTTFTVNSGLADPSDPAPNRISGIVEDREGKIWVASEREGLFYFDEGQQAFIPYYNAKSGLKLSSLSITELSIGQPDELWIGLKDGLNKLNTKSRQVTHFPALEENIHHIAGKEVRGLSLDQHGHLWVGTRANGLYLLKEANQSKKIFDHYSYHPDSSNGLGNNSIFSLFVDRQNQLWVGNENGGLHLYNRSKNDFYRYMPDAKDPFSISNNSIWSIFEDKQGRLWIGTGLKGVNIVDHQFVKFKHYYSTLLNPNGLNNSLVREFWEDQEGNVWVATDGGGLNYWNRSENKFTHYTHDQHNPSSIGSNALLDITSDAEGRLWIATWAGGINILTDRRTMEFKQLQDLQTKDSLAAEIVSSFALWTDPDGNVWSGNFQKGLGFHDQKSKTTKLFMNDPKDKSSLYSNTLYCVFVDSEGNVWGGGENKGLNKMIKNKDGKISFKRYDQNPDDATSLPGDIVNQVFEDSQHNIWVANSGGLSRYVKETDGFVNFSSKHGLPSDFVASVTEDHNGFFWIGTEKGLTKFDPVQQTFRNYTKSDGLQGEKFSRHAVIALSSGELMFGGTNGFNIFHPDEVKDNAHKPEVYLTDLKLFNKSVTVGESDSILKVDISLTKEIELPYHQNVIGLEFVALNYTHSAKNSYAYKLEGLEEDWNYVGHMQVATYTNLDPGEYTFRVKAANNDGVWNEEGTQLKVRVLHPWYRTWWFYLIVCISLAAVFYIFIWWREKRLQKDKTILAQAIEAKTKEIEKKEAEISARDEADKIRNWTALGLNQFSEIVNKNKDDISSLAQNLLSQLVKFMHAAQGTVTILNDDDEHDQFLELVATFAHEEGQQVNTRFELDEGLVGACYSSGEVKYIDKLPEDYSKFSSGLGEARMNYLILVPLRLDEFIVGVVELGSFQPFQEHEIQFLQKLGEMITSSLYTLKVSRRTSLLLEQARSQTEELQAQEEEIRQNMEELEATQEDFYRKEQELLDQLKMKEEENERLREALKKRRKS